MSEDATDCECWPTPPSTWFVQYGKVEPASELEQNPDCPVHPAEWFACDVHGNDCAGDCVHRGGPRVA